MTDVELAKKRKEVRLFVIRDMGLPKDFTFTCDPCAEKASCPYVFNGYNTDGHCLAKE